MATTAPTAEAPPPARPPRKARYAVAPCALPLLGHALPLARRPLDFLTGLSRHGDLVEVRLGRRPAVMVCDPGLIRQVLLEARTYDKGGPLFDKAEELVGSGLFSATFEPHRRQRRMMQPGFHQSRMPGYAAVMEQEIAELLQGWRDGQELDVRDQMHAVTLRIAARTMFTNPLSTRATAEVQECMPLINRGVYKRMVAPTALLEKLPTRENREFALAHERMRVVVDQAITQYRSEGIDHGDLMSILISTVDEETGQGLSEEEIHKQVTTLLAGGMETTANAICSALHLIDGHPQVRRRVRQELDRVLAGRPARFEDVPRLEYLYRVLYETLRLRPPVWLLTRVTTRDAELGGHRLPEGRIILLSPYLLHHNPDLFARPENFDPDRWLPERVDDVTRAAMQPFIMGNRKCIGDKFALTEATLLIATILGAWSMRPVAGTRRKHLPEATLGPGPLPMRLTRRQPATEDTAVDVTDSPREAAATRPDPSTGSCPYRGDQS
ncbi:cytochrome P450 [Streptomyces longisporoflavus]|uniref:cytochrome P450 n=1 Tax=Streptomyces longisporoflavus TaxID=28044 RepID=UPI00167EB5A6|nr:cytochrome P450 [Streptomyces longisporoflavus]GGV58743.1 cytochrome P450 [Streptomyces longisporoflavus]